jgi:hypothetical protein
LFSAQMLTISFFLSLLQVCLSLYKRQFPKWHDSMFVRR